MGGLPVVSHPKAWAYTRRSLAVYPELDHHVIGATSGGAGEDEVGGDEDEDAQEEERPRDYYVPSIGLVNTHSHEEGLEALELIINTGEAMCV
ncbi:hypothetical protein B296_00056318 [Ensete ventricosum]|uniref:Uncharacterized protein n=1 Tax=Ensete ventricosum TaxID=4639 RepID=A0A426X050_ENSVE|nr:hypothetical protein B296_00056318 [Ensete ventricosum]